MIPGRFDFEFYRGDRHEIFVRAKDQIWDQDLQRFVDGSYLDLTGRTITSQLRLAKDSPEIAATLEVQLYDQTVTPGALMVVILPAASALLTEGTYYWDLQTSSSATEVDTFLAGKATCIGDVTR